MRKLVVVFGDEDDKYVDDALNNPNSHFYIGMGESYNDGSHYFYHPESIEVIND